MNGAEVSIRDAHVDDALALTLLSRRCFKKSPEWFVPKFVVCRWWRSVIRHQGCVVRVAGDDDGVLGYALSVYKYDDWARVSHRGAHSKWMKGLVTLMRPAFLKSYLAKRKQARAGKAKSASCEQVGSASTTDAKADLKLERVSVKNVLGENGVYWAIVAVDPESQGRGVGKLLLESVLKFGECAGASRICLHVDARNKRAQGLYAHYGYDLTGRDGNSFLMTKTL